MAETMRDKLPTLRERRIVAAAFEDEERRPTMPSADEVKQSITNWCSSDDDLEIPPTVSSRAPTLHSG